MLISDQTSLGKKSIKVTHALAVRDKRTMDFFSKGRFSGD